MKIKNPTLIGTALVFATFLAFAAPALSQEKKSSWQILFINCNIFDGKTDTLAKKRNVFVEGKLIKAIGDSSLKAASDATVVDCGGRTLMPGLIDSHIHINGYKDGNILTWQDTTWEEIGARAAAMAQEKLAMGFTT
ncbi:MAG: amidohydrolase family protein, partial [Hyphomicrobiaceae bacterium]